MRLKPWMNLIAVISLLLMLLTMPLLTACGGGDDDGAVDDNGVVDDDGMVDDDGAVEEAEFDIVREAVDEYLDNKAGNTKASDLHIMITEDNAPYIVSVRSAEDYAAGHIPSAVNIKFSELTTLPEDEEILIYCYTGQSASMAAALLGVLDIIV